MNYTVYNKCDIGLLTLCQNSDINLRDFEVWKIENLYLWMRRQDHPWPLKR